jgi:flavin reductase (DIM6/NTAB) family NADH-FMN oxidoreductase RutF
MQLNKTDIAALEKRHRTTLVNSLAGFRTAVLVGTVSPEGSTNLAIFNSLTHLGSDPALLGLISRPDAVQRDTLSNITATGHYTLNFVPARHYARAHQTSARYDRGVSEFDRAGLTPCYLPPFPAPCVEEAVVRIAMKLEELMPIRLNGTIMIIGSIEAISLPEGMAGEDGFINLAAADVLISQGLDAYFSATAIGRLPYAKP